MLVNIGQILNTYCANIWQMLGEDCANIGQILFKYCANIVQILCKYWANIGLVRFNEVLDWFLYVFARFCMFGKVLSKNLTH